jgi:hypothetical protein
MVLSLFMGNSVILISAASCEQRKRDDSDVAAGVNCIVASS